MLSSPVKLAVAGFVCLVGFVTLASYLHLYPDAAVDMSGMGASPVGALELREGVQLRLAVDADEVRKDWLEGLRDDARTRLQGAQIPVITTGINNGVLQIRLARPEDGQAAAGELRGVIQQTKDGASGEADAQISTDDGGVITIALTESGLQHRIDGLADAAVEVVRRRIDTLGSIRAQVLRDGPDRILVRVAGLQDTTEVKRLIGRTARFAFHAVHPTMTAEEARLARIPDGYQIYQTADGTQPQLLRRRPVLRGDELVEAQAGFDSRTNEPIISFRFNTSGAQKFAKFTQENVGRPFAMVLDDKVISAPVIREPILGGAGQISGNFSPETAAQLAIQLRSGALPVSLSLIEERTFGPDAAQSAHGASNIGCNEAGPPCISPR
jgi:preprotein translocase subunit SecD